MQVGDEIAGGGAYDERGPGECPGEVFSIYDIRILPDVEVYFPRQDGFLDTRPKHVGFTGELVLKGICLEVEDAIRVESGSQFLEPVLLIWPSALELSSEDGAAKIVDSTVQAVAPVGDRVQFSAFGVPSGWALKHGGDNTFL